MQTLDARLMRAAVTLLACGEWLPGYFVTSDGRAQRVSLVGHGLIPDEERVVLRRWADDRISKERGVPYHQVRLTDAVARRLERVAKAQERAASELDSTPGAPRQRRIAC